MSFILLMLGELAAGLVLAAVRAKRRPRWLAEDLDRIMVPFEWLIRRTARPLERFAAEWNRQQAEDFRVKAASLAEAGLNEAAGHLTDVATAYETRAAWHQALSARCRG